MLIDGTPYRTMWPAADGSSVCLIDQRHLPFNLVIETVGDWRAMATAIRDMHLRGAPLIGVAAAYGVWLACLEYANRPPATFAAALEVALAGLLAARPTAVNLHWALATQRRALAAFLPAAPGSAGVNAGTAASATTADNALAVRLSRALADALAEQDVAICAALGRHGADWLAAGIGDRPLRILTHCNAGWLATVDHGTATAPLYEAARRGLRLEVWVDETRPRNQGALTAWELSQNGIANTVICDNSGGHLMQQGLVDAVIVGTDRTARNGDVANKIGTYLKALAARDNGLPFYVALPSPSFDATLASGVGRIPIEERDPSEVLTVRGRHLVDGAAGADVAGVDVALASIGLYAPGTRAANYAFDVTPARLVDGYITEYGVFTADQLADQLADPLPSQPLGKRPGAVDAD